MHSLKARKPSFTLEEVSHGETGFEEVDELECRCGWRGNLARALKSLSQRNGRSGPTLS